MQALDEYYLVSDAELGGVDQRNIFTFAEKYLPALGYKKRAYLLCHMVGGLRGGKVRASEAAVKSTWLMTQTQFEKGVQGVLCEWQLRR